MTTNITTTTGGTVATKRNSSTWKYDAAVVVDLLKNFKSDRLNDIRKQLRAGGSVGIGDLVEKEFQRYTDNGWDADATKLTNKVLRQAPKLTFLAYCYDDISKQVLTALHANTPVWIWSPYKTPETVHPTSVSEWYELLGQEKSARKDYAVAKSYNEEMREPAYALTSLLTQTIDWLDPKDPALVALSKSGTLYHYAKQFSNYDELRTSMSAIIATIKEEGEWDINVGSTLLQVERSNTYQTLDSKGLRTIGSSEGFNTWNVYETTLADELLEFLSLTYYKHVGIKPLQRVMADDDNDMVVYKKDEALRTTPLYFMDEHEDDTCPLEEMAGVGDLAKLILSDKDLVNKVQAMGYEQAKKLIMLNKLI